jgi:phosphoribosylformylglycinamidine (FGAM) synthase-like enzyme
LQIMIEGPLGGAAFNNEFGRPNLLGYFREYEQQLSYTCKDVSGADVAATRAARLPQADHDCRRPGRD